MFSFFKRSKTPDTAINQLPIALDIHSHILPGIDDGASDVETAVKLIRGLYALGIRRSVATPHIIGDLYRNTPQSINAALDITREACAEAGIDIELSAAAEYMMDDHFMDLLKQNEPLLTIHENYVLTEFSYTQQPSNAEEMLFNLITSGYKPVLAHPERYAYLHRDFGIYRRLKESGFHLQVNLLSLTGYYGKTVAKAAAYILENDLAGLVATDLHHERHLAALQDANNLTLFHKTLAGKRLNAFNS